MELLQLRYFAAAARLLHFTRAAEALYVSQPTLSVQIARLEAELRVALFRRRGRRVELTDAGAALLPHAERLLQAEEEARRAVSQVAGLQRGRLSLCALPALDQHLLPPWLARFRREHPGIELRVRELRPARAVAQAVRAGEADLGFLHLPCEVPGLAVHPLLEEDLQLVVPGGHPLARGASPRLTALAGEEWVWVHEAQERDHPLFAACLAAGFAPRVVCESGSAQGVQALVAAGLGITLLPRLAIEPREGTVAVALAEPRPTRTLAVTWRAGAESHAAAAFLRLCAPGAMGGAAAG